MILFFRTPSKSVIATQVDHQLDSNEINELCWLFGDAVLERQTASRLSSWDHAVK